MAAKVAIFWDRENINFRGSKCSSEFLGKVLGHCKKVGKVQNFHIYGGASGKKYEDFRQIAQTCKAKLIAVESKVKNALDMQLTFDCVRLLGENSPPNIVILIAGDKDYRFLVNCLQREGVNSDRLGPPRISKLLPEAIGQ